PRYSAPKADVLPLDDPAMNEGFFDHQRRAGPPTAGRPTKGGQVCLPTGRQVLRMTKTQSERQKNFLKTQ
ncbi:MAG TPA: hypothetical protein PKU90_02060, partial [Candidatus Paceibacterota bacterium]|nr:hypothetical protein [Candidatus Paceibacterota bacterium]